MTGIGDNSMGNDAIKLLREKISQIESIEAERAGLAEEVKDIKAFLKSQGFDAKIVAKVLQRRKLDAEDRQNQDDLLELYEAALASIL